MPRDAYPILLFGTRRVGLNGLRGHPPVMNPDDSLQRRNSHEHHPIARERRFLWAGMGAPMLVAAAVLGESFARPQVNPLRQSVSMLIEGPEGKWLRLALVCGGLLLLLFAWALNQRGIADRAVFWGQAVSGTGLAMVGLFIQQGPAPESGLRVPSPWGYLSGIGLLHIAGALLLYGGVIASCLAAAPLLRVAPGGGSAYDYSLGNGIAMGAALLIFVGMAAWGGPAGLMERVAGALGAIWEGWWTWTVLRRDSRKLGRAAGEAKSQTFHHGV